MDIGKNLSASFELYQKNFGTLFVAGLLAGLLSGVTLFILVGPLMSGFISLVKKIQRGEKGEISDIFAYTNLTGSMILLTVFLWVLWILCLIPFLNILVFLALIVVGPILHIIIFTTAGLVAEQKKTVQEGIQFVLDKVKANFLQFWIYGLVFGIIGGIGGVLCGIGALLTMPIGMIGMVFAYQSLTDESTSEAPPVAGTSV